MEIDTHTSVIHVTKAVFIVLNPPEIEGLDFLGVHMGLVSVFSPSFPWPKIHLHLGLNGLVGILCSSSNPSYRHSLRDLPASRLVEFQGGNS